MFQIVDRISEVVWEIKRIRIQKDSIKDFSEWESSLHRMKKKYIDQITSNKNLLITIKNLEEKKTDYSR